MAGASSHVSIEADLLQALRDSEARARSILETAVDAIVTINHLGLIESFNPAAEAMFGYRAAEVLGRNVSLLATEEHAFRHDDYLRAYLESGVRRVIGVGRETTAARKDGSTFPIHLSVSEWRLGEARMFTGMIRDLSAERAAQRQALDLAAILEESLNELYVVEVGSLRFLAVNRAARENLGYSLEQLQGGLALPDLALDFTPAQLHEMLEPLRRGEVERIHLSTRHCRRDGTCYPIELQFQEARFQGRAAFAAIGQDLTERLRVEDGMRQAAKMAAMGELAGNIAHEINNPIGIVSAKARLLLSGSDPLPDKVRRDLEKVVHQCDRIAGLTRGMLDYCRPTSSPKAPLDVHVALRKALELASGKTGAKRQVAVTEELSPSLPRVHGSEAELEQVFLNLVINAVHAMPEGGRLTVRSEVTPEGEVVISVSDTGVGMEEEVRARIFEPFFTTKGAEGTGLGLAICASLIRDHKGAIEVDSTPGGGSTFRVRLPAGKQG